MSGLSMGTLNLNRIIEKQQPSLREGAAGQGCVEFAPQAFLGCCRKSYSDLSIAELRCWPSQPQGP